MGGGQTGLLLQHGLSSFCFSCFLIYTLVYTVYIPSFLPKFLGIHLNTLELKWARPCHRGEIISLVTIGPSHLLPRSLLHGPHKGEIKLMHACIGIRLLRIELMQTAA
jgi:hypothetical protein